jgi:hypothetical protein
MGNFLKSEMCSFLKNGKDIMARWHISGIVIPWQAIVGSATGCQLGRDAALEIPLLKGAIRL